MDLRPYASVSQVKMESHVRAVWHEFIALDPCNIHIAIAANEFLMNFHSYWCY